MNDVIDISFTLPRPLVMGVAAVGAVLLMSALVYITLPKDGDEAPLARLRERLGLGGLHPIPFMALLTFWTALATVLALGLLGLIVEVIFRADPKTYLFYVLRIAGLTTVLGAVIALPLTVIRLRLTQKQTETTTESLFNEKINAATEGLYARRQVSVRREDGKHEDVWQDDIVQRCAAIDRLEGLARENNSETPRIARLLSVYVRELSAEVPAQEPPNDASPEDLPKWANALPKPRSDMEKAAQTLGRLHKHAEAPLDNGEIDLRGANLQKCDLAGLAFQSGKFQGAQLQRAVLQDAALQKANFSDADMQRINLNGAQLDGTNLNWVNLRGAVMVDTQLQQVSLLRAQLREAYFEDAKLQAADLTRAILKDANIVGVQLQGTDLSGAQLQGAFLEETVFDGATDLSNASFSGAGCKDVDFTDAPKIEEFLGEMFGDSTVTLPADVEAPKHWSPQRLDNAEFADRWFEWQATLPDGWDK